MVVGRPQWGKPQGSTLSNCWHGGKTGFSQGPLLEKRADCGDPLPIRNTTLSWV